VSELEQNAPRFLRDYGLREPDPNPPSRDLPNDLDVDRSYSKRSVIAKPKPIPLVVDLDGTLVRSDLLIETAFSELGRRPQSIFDMLKALRHGKSALKHRLSEPADFDPAVLPYDDEVLRCIHTARDMGRPVYLASASHERLVEAVADYLGLFEGWFATDEAFNCAGAAKAQRLVDFFGVRGFDYIGNDAADLDVWPHARKALAIRTSERVRRCLDGACADVEHLDYQRPGWKAWAKLFRVHQYAKNGLVFLPIITSSHLLEWTSIVQVLAAAVAFSLCASSVYIINDLVDLQDDRGHRTKRHRPLANGSISLAQAVLAVPLLLGTSITLAADISLQFLGVLLGYYVLTTAYSFFLKRKLLADVLALAGLYTVRVVGGAVAAGIGLSPWLLAFVLAWFLSLALIKRYVELQARQGANLPDSTSRDYRNDDINMIGALAAAAGFNAITLFMIYSTGDGERSYSNPELLWFVAPVLTYWLARALVLARRGEMHDDPVVFALKDRVSVFTLAIAGAMLLGAM
jgi:4-hydroxybenzoate polyprenyltransferase/phosphoserine phosphatase